MGKSYRLHAPRGYADLIKYISVFENPGYNPTGERFRIHVYPKSARSFQGMFLIASSGRPLYPGAPVERTGDDLLMLLAETMKEMGLS